MRPEVEQIRAEFERRDEVIPQGLYSLSEEWALFNHQRRSESAIRALKRAGMFPLTTRRVLEVGCGTGDWLLDFLRWGARLDLLAGMDLVADRLAVARARLPGADLRCGDARRLHWDEASFDVVLQSTVFTSVLDQRMKMDLAAEMTRVLKPGGVVLWYDFFWNNPTNHRVRGVGAREIRRLFPGFTVRLERITLAPPLARRLVPKTSLVALALEKLRVLNTHYLGVFSRSA